MINGPADVKEQYLEMVQKVANRLTDQLRSVVSMVDISFDFTSDSHNYWKNFWENNGGMGGGSSDPDSASKTLQKYHQYLWSKKLPNGEFMDLRCGSGAEYLTWKDVRFASDSIIVSFRYQRNRDLMESVAKAMPDYRSFVENYIHRSYTIGGMMIFPKHMGSINQRRGTHKLICDRWDLTLECIRRFYSGESSPLYSTLQREKDFLKLFVNFKGYVDYFFLQDCVSQDYSQVKIWLGKGNFDEEPLPRTVEQYLLWIESEMSFLNQRNKRIENYVMGKKGLV